MGQDDPANMADLPPRVALVYDRVNKWGGAERVLLALHELFPQAPLFTAVYDSSLAPWAQVFPQVIPSFLQKFPGAKSNHELYPWLTPLAFESLKFDNFDLVISVTSADAKGIITKPSTFHLCYCLTPTRYLWSHEVLYRDQVSNIASPLFNYLKSWDKIASTRPDAYVAISQTVKDRIDAFYHRDSTVVYPPTDADAFAQEYSPPTIQDYFLWVGRLVAYKRAELVVETFNKLQLPLVVVGLGKLAQKLQRIARKNIYLVGHQSEEELTRYYQHAKALIFFHEEDYGIVPVEAMAAGTPVIGLNRGGVSETVVHGITGYLVGDSPDELKNAILNFDRSHFDRQQIRAHAQKFSKVRFKKEFTRTLIRLNLGRRRGDPAVAPIARALP